MRTRRISGWIAGIAAAVVVATTAAVAPAATAAAGPPEGEPWIVSLGDSYISGEAGRWAGNSDLPGVGDQLGATAYWDTNSGEAIPGCHRSKSAEIYIGNVRAKNLACSGATTGSYANGKGGWTPGIDFIDLGDGRVGQATLLQQFASTNRVRIIVLSIGGNDMGFSSVVESCVLNFILSPYVWKSFCKDSDKVQAKVSDDSLKLLKAKLTKAYENIATAMAAAHYETNQWTLVVQTYPSPIPTGDQFRYWQTMRRYTAGGCPFWDADADWANNYVLKRLNATVAEAADSANRAGIANVRVLDLSQTFTGARLCEKGVDLLAWDQKLDQPRTAEWVQQIRLVTPAIGGQTMMQESIHPNYWGQLGIRKCVRAVWNNGVPQSGSCKGGNDGKADANGEPTVTFTPLPL